MWIKSLWNDDFMFSEWSSEFSSSSKMCHWYSTLIMLQSSLNTELLFFIRIILCKKYRVLTWLPLKAKGWSLLLKNTCNLIVYTRHSKLSVRKTTYLSLGALFIEHSSLLYLAIPNGILKTTKREITEYWHLPWLREDFRSVERSWQRTILEDTELAIRLHPWWALI